MELRYNKRHSSKGNNTMPYKPSSKFKIISVSIEKKAGAILENEMALTGKTKSFIIRELIWNLAKNNEAA